MNRACIILDKNLDPGKACNAAAILMGQLSCKVSALYASKPPQDTSGLSHVGIEEDAIVLSAKSPIQLRNVVNALQEQPNIELYVFTAYGQALHGSPTEYKAYISESSDEELIGAAVYGEYETVKRLTKKLSLYR